jgi:hypothetical protein
VVDPGDGGGVRSVAKDRQHKRDKKTMKLGFHERHPAPHGRRLLPPAAVLRLAQPNCNQIAQTGRAKNAKSLPRKEKNFSAVHVDLKAWQTIKQTKTNYKGHIMSDLNDPLKESYIGKVGLALKPYAAEFTRRLLRPDHAHHAAHRRWQGD